MEFIRPRLHSGGMMGRPMTWVNWSSTSNGDGPMRKYRSITPPVTCQVTRVSVSATSMALLFISTTPCAVPSAHPETQGYTRVEQTTQTLGTDSSSAQEKAAGTTLEP